MQRDDATILDIYIAATEAIEFRGQYDEQAFRADIKTQSAVLHKLLIIGEATKRLSPEFREAHSGIPWKDIAGMRDRLIHQYDQVDLKQVWDSLVEGLPVLVAFLQPLVPQESPLRPNDPEPGRT
jgi:uncharacterized protein with HEPN domain